MNAASTKTFFSYVIPSVFAFALSGVYTIVDGFFVGQSLGDIGLASITLGYPVSALIGAIGTGIGLAGASRFTIMDAQGETAKRQECFTGTTLLMLLVSVVLAALLFFAIKKCRLKFPAFGDLRVLWKQVLQVPVSPFGLTFSPTITMLLMNRFCTALWK